MDHVACLLLLLGHDNQDVPPGPLRRYGCAIDIVALTLFIKCHHLTLVANTPFCDV